MWICIWYPVWSESSANSRTFKVRAYVCIHIQIYTLLECVNLLLPVCLARDKRKFTHFSCALICIHTNSRFCQVREFASSRTLAEPSAKSCNFKVRNFVYKSKYKFTHFQRTWICFWHSAARDLSKFTHFLSARICAILYGIPYKITHMRSA